MPLSMRNLTPLRPLRGLQETRVATREESGVLGFPSQGLTGVRRPLWEVVHVALEATHE